ncbi:MAG TPA: metallophosphoesterase [Alphaproteobacteria bacterium]|nr:metallophosphoesterase [Alphaproteobacteria bacterium]
MRYAIISDIHGNIESLERAFSLMEPEDQVLCLGDIVGYGPNPNECISLLRTRLQHAVLGNHDLAALENFGVEYFNDAARAAIAWTQTVLTEESRDWLNGLSYEIRYPDFLMVHGAPVNYFEYILDKRTASKAFALTDAPLVFIGHTHIAEYWVSEPDGTVGHRHMQQGGELRLEDGKRYIVDVGSIGQPRDLNPEASFVFYEPQSRKVEWVRYPYPIRDVQEKIHEAHLPEYLAMRLESGR